MSTYPNDPRIRLEQAVAEYSELDRYTDRHACLAAISRMPVLRDIINRLRGELGMPVPDPPPKIPRVDRFAEVRAWLPERDRFIREEALIAPRVKEVPIADHGCYLKAIGELGRFIADHHPENFGSYLAALIETGDVLAINTNRGD